MQSAFGAEQSALPAQACPVQSPSFLHLSRMRTASHARLHGTQIAAVSPMRMGVPTCANAAVMCAVFACSSHAIDSSAGTHADDNDGSREASREARVSEPDAACLRHTACELYTPLSCSAGEVSAIVDPCMECGPSFWKPVHRCVRGCRIDYAEILAAAGDYVAWSSSEELCEETRPKEAGDACQSSADCRPSPVTYRDGGYVPQQYLLCHEGACVSTSPPVINGWMTGWGCGEVIGAPAGIQVVPASGCGGGLCLLVEEVNGCRPQTCTARCTGDEDCPPESICGYFPNSVRACKPGYLPNDFSALRCARGPVDGGSAP